MKPLHSELTATTCEAFKEFVERTTPLHGKTETWANEYRVSTYSNNKGQVIAEVHFLPNGQKEHFVRQGK